MKINKTSLRKSDAWNSWDDKQFSEGITKQSNTGTETVDKENIQKDTRKNNQMFIELMNGMIMNK